ncbi:hypothetical protein LCGC14_0615240 [marine sediment metagenome]|uniref:Uncharacterized protein n=1 Tax=marine sediment metagenome TaxID=412755 RepID=A0A0F9RBA2_9ZZZZ|nr:hypothetical protein [Pricia sp.]HEC64632.1 hypothetical protein [bacterium]
MKKTTVMLPQETIDWLREKSHKEHTSVGAIIRKAIDALKSTPPLHTPDNFGAAPTNKNPEEKVYRYNNSDPVTEEKPWKEITRCEFQACRKDAIGNFNISTYSTDTGDQITTKHLCKLHKHLASKEGAVTDV